MASARDSMDDHARVPGAEGPAVIMASGRRRCNTQLDNPLRNRDACSGDGRRPRCVAASVSRAFQNQLLNKPNGEAKDAAECRTDHPTAVEDQFAAWAEEVPPRPACDWRAPSD